MQSEDEKVNQQKNQKASETLPTEDFSKSDKMTPPKTETEIDEHAKVVVPVSSNLPLDEVDQRISDIMSKNESGKYVCTICGKNSKKHIQNMRNHIETHLDGISFSCQICNRQYRSRNSLNKHKSVEKH